MKNFFVAILAFVLITYTETNLIYCPSEIICASPHQTIVPRVKHLSFLNQHYPIPDVLPSSSPLSSLQPTWQRLDFSIIPSPRIGSSFALNTTNKVAYMFGGIDSSVGELNDLWLTNGLVWLQFQTPHSPDGRSDASMTYDEASQTGILFGGIKNPSLLGDTWLFNGVDWLQQHPLVSPTPRSHASIAYDANKNLTILFGGLVDTGGKFDEASDGMWVWDGSNWQQQFPALLPPPRWGANMAYDRARKAIVLFGGAIDGGYREDTWLWDGISWIEQHPLRQPAGRANFGMVYDEVRQQVVIFGGQSYADVDPTETWVWDGQDWSPLPTSQSPPKEMTYAAQLVYLPTLRSVALYNASRKKTIGSDGEIYIFDQSEVWVLTYRDLVYLPIIRKS